MNFYLDFEATQFSNRIISIGCVADNGEKFNTLVKPVNGAKVNTFIAKLTGITQEMVNEAPSADEAFANFFAWYVAQGAAHSQFYVYGNDKQYIDATVKYMEDPTAVIFATFVRARLVDYSKIAAEYLNRNGVALRALVAMVESEKEVVQRHDALEDAEWLKLVADHLDEIPVEAEVPNILRNRPSPGKTTDIISNGPFPELKFISTSKEPEVIHGWQELVGGLHSPFDIPHEGDESNWVVRAWNHNREIFFADYKIAVYWATKVLCKHSVKKSSINYETWRSMKSAAKNGRMWAKMFWEIKSVEQEEENKDENA